MKTNLKNENDLRNEDDLKNKDNHKNDDDLKNEEDLKNEDDLKNEEDLKNWPSTPKIFCPPPSPQKLPTFFLMTSQCNSNTTTDFKPEMTPGV